LALKKSLLLYFITLPNLNVIADIFYFPESILEDTKFFFSISSFLIQKNIKIGLSISTQSIHTPQNLENPLDYLSNPLPIIQSYCSKYNIHSIHLPVSFGKRRIQKSPKNEEYSLQSQFNWTNISLILLTLSSLKINLLIEPILEFFENSAEDYYIHMRQILWEGHDTLRKCNLKMSQLTLLISPFFPKLKGLRDVDILDPSNIANTTLRCITECLTKEKMEILIRSCNNFGIFSYGKFVKFIKTYRKEISINPFYLTVLKNT